MKFTKFALTKLAPKEDGNTAALGYIAIFLPGSKKEYGDIQAFMTLTAEGIGVSDSFSGSFTTKFGIRTELTVDELRTISQFCASRAQDIITAMVDTQKTRRQTYTLTEPFGTVVQEAAHTSLYGGDYFLQEVNLPKRSSKGKAGKAGKAATA